MTWGRKKRGKRGYFSKLRDKARSRMKQQLKSRGGKLASKRRLDRRVKRGKSRILGGLKRPKNRVTDRKLNFTQRVEAGRKLSLKNAKREEINRKHFQQVEQLKERLETNLS